MTFFTTCVEWCHAGVSSSCGCASTSIIHICVLYSKIHYTHVYSTLKYAIPSVARALSPCHFPPVSPSPRLSPVQISTIAAMDKAQLKQFAKLAQKLAYVATPAVNAYQKVDKVTGGYAKYIFIFLFSHLMFHMFRIILFIGVIHFII